MEKFYYRRLDVYKNSKVLIIDIHNLLKEFPTEEKKQLAKLRTIIANNKPLTPNT